MASDKPKDDRTGETSGHIVDPTAPAPAPQLLALSREDLIAIITATQPSDDFLKKQADYNAEAQRRAMRPENQFFPDRSVFNPAGERDHPRVMPGYEVYVTGMPIRNDVNTVAEIELCKRLRAGQYLVSKSDGSRAKVVVSIDRDDDGQIKRLQVNFTTRGQHKHNWLSLEHILTEIVNQEPIKVGSADAVPA